MLAIPSATLTLYGVGECGSVLERRDEGPAVWRESERRTQERVEVLLTGRLLAGDWLRRARDRVCWRGRPGFFYSSFLWDPTAAAAVCCLLGRGVLSLRVRYTVFHVLARDAFL